MLHPHTELKRVSDSVGYGVFASKAIPRGTITWALDPFDQVLSELAVRGLDRQHAELLTRYTWLNSRGERILCWDFARFMNHDCQANTLWAGGFDFELAVRDIRAGEQLTCDYGALNLEQPFHCECGSSACRRTIRPDDFARYARDWDLEVQCTFPYILKVEQPLWKWVKLQARAIHRGARAPAELPSVLQHHWAMEPKTVGATAFAR